MYHMLYVISAWCVACDLHTIAPGPLEYTCWRRFEIVKKSWIAPFSAIIIIIIIIIIEGGGTAGDVVQQKWGLSCFEANGSGLTLWFDQWFQQINCVTSLSALLLPSFIPSGLMIAGVATLSVHCYRIIINACICTMYVLLRFIDM